MTFQNIQKQQIEFCQRYSEQCLPPSPDSKLGFALLTQGLLPINGLRHPPQGETNGWYVWCGEELSSDEDFFAPMHTYHLADHCRPALKFLGLPPGYRFLLAGDYADVWYDESLLQI